MDDIPQIGIPELYKEHGMHNGTIHPGLILLKARNMPEYLKNGNPFRNINYGISFFVDDNCEISIDNNSYTPKKNTVYFCGPGQVIKIKGEFKDGGIGILFQTDFILKHGAQQWIQSLPIFNRFLREPLIELTDGDLLMFQTLLKRLETEYHSNNTLKYDALEAQLTLILIELSRLYEESKGTKKNIDTKHILALESLINKQFKYNRSVVNYASQLCVTPQHLNRITKKTMGKSVSELINEKLIMEIKRYLVYTDMSCEEIAHIFNFHDNSYFTKTFKKAVGETPKAFRKQQKELYLPLS